MDGRFRPRRNRLRGLRSSGNSSLSRKGFLDSVEQVRFHAPVRQQNTISGLRGVRVRIPRGDLGRDAYPCLFLSVSDYLNRALVVATREAIPRFGRRVSKSVEDRQAPVESGMELLNHLLDFHLRMMKQTVLPMSLV